MKEKPVRLYSSRLSLLLPILLLLLFSLTISGCIGESSDPPNIIMGWVFAEEPIIDSHVTIYDIKDEQIGDTELKAVGVHGSFLFKFDPLPTDFRIVAHEGTHKGDAFSHELVADFRGFNPNTDVVYVNVVTTIISAYIDKNPGITLDEADSAVKFFLDIPEWMEIESVVQATPEFFDHTKFMAEADLNGGLTAYIDLLTDEIDGVAIHSFHGEPVVYTRGDPNNVKRALTGAFLAEQLAGGVAGAVGEQLLGMGLAYVGLGPANPQAKTDAEIAQMQAQLKQISNELTVLETQMTSLLKEVTQADYNSSISNMNPLFSSIKSVRQQVTTFVCSPHSKSADLDTTRTLIMNSITAQLMGKDTVMSDNLVGNVGATPLLKTWSQIIRSQHRFLSKNNYPTILSQFNYFDGMQGWLAVLMAEYYNAMALKTNDTDFYARMVTNTQDNYNTNFAAEAALVRPTVPDGIWLDTANNYMIWLPDNYHLYMNKFTNHLGHEDFDGGTTGKIALQLEYIDWMNKRKHLGHNDWRLPTDTELYADYGSTTGHIFNWGDGWWQLRVKGFSIMAKERYIPSTSTSHSRFGYYYNTTNNMIYDIWDTDFHGHLHLLTVRKMTSTTVDTWFH